MKRDDFTYTLDILLLLSIIITGILGYIQSQLDLRKFYPHRYFAYTTLSLAAIHVYFNLGKVWRYFRRKTKDSPQSSEAATKNKFNAKTQSSQRKKI